MQQYYCPNCQLLLSDDGRFAGTVVSCPRCFVPIQVPEPIAPPIGAAEDLSAQPLFVTPNRSRPPAPKPKQDNLLYVILGVIAFLAAGGFFTLRPFDRESFLQEQEATEEFFLSCEAAGLTRDEVIHVAKGLSEQNYSEKKKNHILGQLPQVVRNCGGVKHFRQMMYGSDEEFFRGARGMDSEDLHIAVEIKNVFPSRRR